MAKQVVLAIFPDEGAADTAAQSLKDWDKLDPDVKLHAISVGGVRAASTTPIPAPLPQLRRPSLWVLTLPFRTGLPACLDLVLRPSAGMPRHHRDDHREQDDEGGHGAHRHERIHQAPPMPVPARQPARRSALPRAVVLQRDLFLARRG